MENAIFEIAASSLTFIALWFVFGGLILKPFFRVLEEREARTTGDEGVAVHKKQQAKAKQQELDELMRQARIEGVIKRDERVSSAKAEAQAIIDKASQQASQELRRAEEMILDLKETALKDVPAEAEKLSKVVINRALLTDTSRTIH